jgi:histidinol-phosphatase (PHP family)
VLTDYHLHLRPDEAGTTFERFFTAANVERYREAATAAGIEELGVSEHVYRFRQALDLWSHPLWLENANDDLDAYCEFVRGTSLRLGVECDYVPGAEARTAELLEARDFDYVVGSVHFVGEGDAAVDHDGFDVWEGGGDAEEVWTRYFDHFNRCARSGLFDILAHPDLVKVWGRDRRPLPEGDLRRFYEPAVEAIVAGGSAVELSTAGLRKPVGELYPARAFAELIARAGVPFALSSDAHLPEQVGYGYDRGVAFLEELGVEEIAVFEGRRRRLEPLGSRVG